MSTKVVNVFATLLTMSMWSKARVIYYVNNWVYTTNHKRIAVNYFWFVIFSGICGMVLATIIRLEMAYPGVGILAGDSLQYLSVVTAHAVIMVFFMIMPLLFGAFGNFLLPTQLGVHDVAFPRLNSAAFWFLPAGLIMLCQLVCLDRRYQRMNCFNIREVQALLKGRFFNDLVDCHEHRELLNNTTIGIRFKTNNLDSINPNMLLFYRHGLNTNGQNRVQSYLNSTLENVNTFNFFTNQSHYYSTLGFFNSNLNHIIVRLTSGMYISLLNLLTIDYTLFYNNISGKGSFFDFIHEVNTFIKGEVERLFNNLTNWFNFGEPTWLFVSFYRNYFLNSFENLFYGWYSNNMGVQKNRRHFRVVYSHPGVNTDDSLVEFVFSYLYAAASRSVLILVRNFGASVSMSYDRWANKLETLVTSLQVHFGRVFSNHADSIDPSNPSLFVNFTSMLLTLVLDIVFNVWYTTNCLFHNVYNGVTSFNFIGYVTTKVTSRLLSVESLLGLVDISLFNSHLQTWLIATASNDDVRSESTDLHYASQTWSANSLDNQILFNNAETSLNFRYQRFLNPIFRFDYKSGNYVTKAQIELNPSWFNTIIEITGGIRKASWFYSASFVELFNQTLSEYSNVYSGTAGETASKTSINIEHTHAFYNFFNLLSNEANFINHRWLAINSMDQKFYRMFTTSSMQQRIYSNWRQLKFTREAWRCKLLAARHQKTMYRRYVDEDGIVWAIERNAKDVLPGWAMITPFSARSRFTAIGKVDIGLAGVFLVLNSSIVSSANFLVTYRYLSTLNNRKMRDARSFFTEGVMVASWMMIAANPMLAIGILMLLSDRHWQTSFFDYSGGGDTVLFQHMFWFFGHPEVYVIMIPAFGFNNTILSFYLRKRVSARASLLYSMYTIAFLGFFVWGHHMYMVGLAHTTRMLFSTLTVMISVPAATKLMHWCVTLVNSSFSVELPFLFTLLFIFFFVSGGISGMAVAHTGMDILFHDSFYVIGHFHVMLAGSAMFASFGAFYFYFPSIFGVKFSRIWGYLHLVYYLLGQLMTVIPMFWLGYSGMPRRVLDYPASLGGWHAIVSAGHLLSVAGLMAFFIMIFDSLRQGRAVTRNTLGISRFNTRLNFYLYEVARNRLIQRRGWFISRFNYPSSLALNELNYTNNEVLETTLYSYTLVQK